jgi:predicted anti-sigma-YlaC factor YlaD
MTNHMTCDQLADSLSDYLEGTAGANTRSAIDAHALACAECGSLLAELRQLRVDAANLPELAPRRDLWAGIAARIETPVVELKNGGTVERVNRGTQRRMNRFWVGLAAAGLVAVTATLTYEMTKQTIVAGTPAVQTAAKPDSTPTNLAAAPVPSQQTANADTVPPLRRSTVAPSGSMASTSGSTATPSERSSAPSPQVRLASSKASVEQTYDREIARLRLIVNRRRSSLDSTTVAVIEYNLKVIDDAIAQCKQALAKDPASRFLIESLNDALDTKIQLLRTAAMLPSRT